MKGYYRVCNRDPPDFILFFLILLFSPNRFQVSHQILQIIGDVRSSTLSWLTIVFGGTEWAVDFLMIKEYPTGFLRSTIDYLLFQIGRNVNMC